MNKDLTTIAHDLAQAMVEIAKTYRFVGKWYEAVAILESGLVVDELSNHDRAALQTALAGFLIKHANYDRAEQLLSAAHENLKGVDDPSLEADTLYESGELVYFQTWLHDFGTYATAQDYHQRALDIRKASGDDIGVINSLGRIGILYERDGDMDKALEIYEEAIALSEKINYLLGKKRPQTHIGSYHQRNGDLETALKYYETALEISQTVGEVDGIMFGLNNVGQAIFRLRNDIDGALDYLNQALEIAEKIGHQVAIFVNNLRLGMVYTGAGAVDKARASYEKSAAVAEACGFKALQEHAMEQMTALESPA